MLVERKAGKRPVRFQEDANTRVTNRLLRLRVAADGLEARCVRKFTRNGGQRIVANAEPTTKFLDEPLAKSQRDRRQPIGLAVTVDETNRTLEQVVQGGAAVGMSGNWPERAEFGCPLAGPSPDIDSTPPAGCEDVRNTGLA